ncbi:MAG: SGNH/GDSL hydrolase family protein [Blastococcus sp.]
MRRLAACALTVLAFVLVGAPASQASSPIRYVALGDSYSAASGVLPPDPAASPGCMRSILNYPHDIAAATGAQLTDVTCGAAQTKDFFESQQPGVAPQLDAVSADTQLVTMTIGGNDSGVFIDSIVECGAAGASTAGQGSPCKDRYGSSFEDTIRTTTYPALVKALQAVRARAPHAKVAILGYPWILPPTVGCFDKMPIAEGDVPYLRSEQATLNDAVKRAAAATGAKYVDMSTVSEGHDACQPIGTRWIEPVLQGTNAVIVHPNALGEQQMAAQTIRVLHLG